MVYYPSLGDYLRVAADQLGTTTEQIARLPRIGLAESALASPRAGFGDHEAYPTLIEKAAVLLEHLARNHPLPDANKRCAFLVTESFLEANGKPILESDPDTDVPMVERTAAGETTQAEIIDWLQQRTTPAET